MNWDVIATIAEIVGASGVIISLVYLGIQVRHPAKQEEFHSLQSARVIARTSSFAYKGKDIQITDVECQSFTRYQGLRQRSTSSFVIPSSSTAFEISLSVASSL